MYFIQKYKFDIFHLEYSSRRIRFKILSMLVKKIIFNKGIILDTISTSFSRNILFIRIFLSRKDSFSLYREFSFISFLLDVIIRKTPGLQYHTHTHTNTCIIHIKH